MGDPGLVFVAGGEGDELLLGVICDLKDDVLKREFAEARMGESFRAGAEGRDLMAWPPGADFGAGLVEEVDELDEGGVVGVPGGRRPKSGELRAGFLLPVDEHVAGGGFGERPGEDVARLRRPDTPVSPQEAGGTVCAQHVKVASGDVGRAGVEAIDERSDGGSECLGRVMALGLQVAVDDLVQVRAFGGAELEGVSKRVEHLARRGDVSALLEERVVGRGDRGEQSDFLAAQAPGPPAAPGGQADIGRL